MPKIQELSPLLANQIAAGEVVERPASVVKELVENALDAGATTIDIVVTGAGQQMIKVVDNGQGIAESDVPLAFKRHATSKITSRHDLFSIQSLGFRGEALPAIAAVADVTLTSAQADCNGIRYRIRGGEVLGTHPGSGRQGTTIVVSDLFYNTPARLKYLKKPATELAHVTDIVTRLALAFTTVAFRLVSERRELLKTTGNGNRQQVLAAIYGRELAQKMLPLHGDLPHASCDGFLALPEVTRGSRDHLTLLINHRFVKNRALTNAVIRGFAETLMVGRYPVGVVNVTLDPLRVDVNVHPQKAEVRLADERVLAEALTTLVQQHWQGRNLVPQPTVPAVPSAPRPAAESVVPAPWATATVSQPDQQPAPTTVMITSTADLTGPAVHNFQQKYQLSPQKPPKTPLTVEKPAATVTFDEPVVLPSASESRSFPDLDYIGQCHGTYLLAQSADGLYLIDQHAAQERLNYERYRREFATVADNQQQLLLPIVLEYPLRDFLVVSDHHEQLAAVGMNLAIFGERQFIVRQHPTWLPAERVEATVRTMIDWVLQQRQITVADFRDRAAAFLSCKQAVKANHYLDNRQATALLTKLAAAANPYHCPHGRPVLTLLSTTDMAKMFKRVQDSHASWLEDDFQHHPN